MSGRFQPLEIPPGVVATATKKMRSSNWSEVNCVRWTEGQLTPVGGQAQIIWSNAPAAGGYGTYDYSDGTYGTPRTPMATTGFASRCKAIHGWYGLAGTPGAGYHVAYVCERNVYVDTGGVLIEITPTGGWAPPPMPTSGGYGELLYGQDLYGTPRASGIIQPLNKLPNVWSVDNFGAILLVMNSTDGRLLEWDPASTVGTKLTATANAPPGRFFVVTQERFVVIFGALTADGFGSARRFAWCDQETRTAWDFTSVTSQAGFLDIEPASPIVCGIATRTGVLFFTGKKAYRSRYLGLPYVYNYEELADSCTPWSCESMATTSSMVLWMSEQGVFSFDGTSILPVQCKVRPWVDDDIDILNVREQACAVHLSTHNEWWWFFPQNGQPYNTRAIIFGYKEGWWSQARMSRSAGVTASYNVRTIMADGTIAIEHEVYHSINSAGVYVNAEPPFAETFDLNLVGGGQLITVKQLLPDIEIVGDEDQSAIADLRYSLFYRNSRSIGLAEQQSPFKAVRRDGYVDFRTTGRDVRLRIDLPVGIVPPFTIGQHQIDIAVRADR